MEDTKSLAALQGYLNSTGRALRSLLSDRDAVPSLRLLSFYFISQVRDDSLCGVPLERF